MTGAYVLDASVAAPWVLPSADEPFSVQARSVLAGFLDGRTDLLIPDLFYPEIGNVLRKAEQRGRITASEADSAADSLLALNLPAVPTPGLMKDAIGISRASGRSVYDSTYLALSVLSGRPLLTADERLANAVGSRFSIAWIGILPV